MAALISFIQAHLMIICGVAYAVLNEIVAQNSKWAANSIVQLVLPFLKKESGQA